jgi:hypothetical protein
LTDSFASVLLDFVFLSKTFPIKTNFYSPLLHLELEDGIRQYELPLFFRTYMGTSALDIAEIDFVDLQVKRNILITSQLTLELGLRQIIPFRIQKTSPSPLDSTSPEIPGTDPGASSGVPQWGGFQCQVALTTTLL